MQGESKDCYGLLKWFISHGETITLKASFCGCLYPSGGYITHVRLWFI